MPFYVFRISAQKGLENLGEELKYRSAINRLGTLRTAHPVEDGTRYPGYSFNPWERAKGC